MDFYSGVPISERVLLRDCIMLIIGVVVMIVIAFVFLKVMLKYWDKDITPNINKKTAIVKELESKDLTDKNIAKRLAQTKRQIKKYKKKLIDEIAIISIVLAMIVGFEIFAIAVGVPTLKDYIKKDYVVYTGEFELVDPYWNDAYIELEDGTRLGDGVKGDNRFAKYTFLTEGKNYGTVVYAKRSGIVLGIKE